MKTNRQKGLFLTKSPFCRKKYLRIFMVLIWLFFPSFGNIDLEMKKRYSF